MQFAVIQRVMGLLLVIFSITQIPPIIVSLIYHDGALKAFIIAYVITLITGLVLWLPVHDIRKDIRLRDGFVIVVLFWILLALFGALPFAVAEKPHMPFTDAFFESMSGLTTTGSTTLVGIDDLPASIRYYRQQLQWLGGMGIVVLAVAVMPMLGVGGMQLYRAETPGPIKDNKLTPRITETAKALWYIYLGLTIICLLAYWAAGMTFFDALGHSFSTVSTGGYSTHDDSIGYFKSLEIEVIAVIFMILSGINFALHFLAWRQRSPRPYIKDPEANTYLKIIFMVAAITVALFLYYGLYDSWQQNLQYGVFQSVSIITSTGFTTTGYSMWPMFLPAIMLMASFIGGCGGSTSGGMKVIRTVLLYKQGVREIFRLIHPDAVFPIKVGGKPMADQVISAVWGFFVLYIISFVILASLMLIAEQDVVTAFSAVAAALNNLGPGLGNVSANYAGVSDFGKWVLVFAMMLGRLEFFTLLVLLTPTFWRN